MERFRYRPLPIEIKKDHIRVIELLPGNASMIECNIHEVSLTDHPPYDALSYCWGESKTKLPISMEGRYFEVTENLCAALWFLRDANEKRLLWADAICIDQTNIAEKNHQVQLMRDIYKNAKRTIIWVGAETAEMRQGFDIIPTLVRAYEEKWTLGVCMSMLNLVVALPSLWALLDNPYFSRIWVVQEVAVSRDRLVVCGNSTVPWSDLTFAIGYSRDIGFSSFINQPNALSFWALHKSLWDAAYHTDRGLLQLLIRHRSCGATDPKDKIYALLGLSTTAGHQGKSVEVQPNYGPELSVEDVFRSTAVQIIRTSRNLDIFSVPRALSPNRLKTLPSWVPDWTVDEPTSSLLLLQDTTDSRSGYFATLPSSEAEPRFQPDGPIVGLGLRGQLIDRIQEVGTVFVKPNGLAPSEFSHGKAIRSLRLMVAFHHERAMIGLTLLNWRSVTRAKPGQIYLTGELILDVYWQTFLAGSAHLGLADHWKKEREAWESIFQAYSYPCYLGLHYSTTAYVVAMFIIEFFSFLYVAVSVFGQFGPFKPQGAGFGETAASSSVHENRRMFRTETGYIGLGPRNMRVGDRIALFSGGSLPLVMREKKTKLKLVGDCYVHGIMYGERYREDQCELMWIV
ncbi:HET-domain-containing protein [Stipitochalara longipes BDJ]|nr:HET-domain-containing protein [Stipitochalara longipes BDJ]